MTPEPISPDHVDAHWRALVAESSSQFSGTHAELPDELKLLRRLNEVRKLLQEDSTAKCANDATTTAEVGTIPLTIGARLGGYEITRLLGRGGMAVVYAARQLALGRDVALKLVRSGPFASPDDLARFESEASAAAGLQHPGIVSVYDTGVWQGLHYFSMQLVDGPTLSQKLSGEPMDVREAALVMIKIASAVQHAHEHGILHRDIKPSNVIIEAASGEPFVADFGLAKLFQSEDSDDLTLSGTIIGTPSYMSPEQALGESKRVSPASDVYSMGAIFYELLTGRAPFRAASTIETARQVIEDRPVAPQLLNSTVPSDLQTICLKALAKDPQRRYASAHEFAADVQRFIDSRPIQAKPASAFESVWLWSKRNRALTAAIGVSLTAMILGTTVSTVMWARSERNARRAENVAMDLRASRQRLRNSVSSFQGKILSDQALHLQMSDKFRSEMFDDVIAYLDEFAVEASDFLDEALVREYLAVAESALEINEPQQAALASRRALDCVRASANSSDPEIQLLLHRASRIAHESLIVTRDGEGRTPEKGVLDEASALLEEMRTASERALELAPLNRAAILAHFQSRYSSALMSDKSEVAPTVLRQLFEDLSSFRDPPPKVKTRVDTEVARLACDIGWKLAALQQGESALGTLEEIAAYWIPHLRESLFSRRRPIFEYHFRKGANTERRAHLLQDLGDTEGALTELTAAQHDLRRAVEGCPQNRAWIARFADCKLQLAEWHLEDDNLYLAGANYEDAIRQNVRLNLIDANDFERRKQTIAIFVRLGQLEERQKYFFRAAKAYHTASMDCRLLFRSVHCEWAFRVRLWLLSQAVKCNALLPEDTDEATDASDYEAWLERFNDVEGRFRDHAPQSFPEFDTSSIAAILRGEHVPVMPPDLAPDRIGVGFGK